MPETLPDSERIRAYEAHLDSIYRSIVSDIKKQSVAKIELLTDYIAITRKATAGETIRADDLNAAAEKYNKKVDGLLTRHKDYISTITGVSEDERKYLLKLATKIEEILRKKDDDWIKKWKDNDPEIVNIAANLDNAFITQHLSNAPSINLTLPDGIDTPEKLISVLLKNNSGIAIGDMHLRDATINFLSENMGNFKKSGVDTVYLELDQNDFSILSKLSVDELKNKLEEFTPEASKKMAQLWANGYGAGRADDFILGLVKLFLAAKENGVDIINIDVKGEARKADPARVSTTNFVWTDAIKKDREQNHKTGKYAVFGGLAHFSGSGLYELGTDLHKERGFIDDALGLPVIAFDKREAGKGEFVLRGTSANGADFYLPAGDCYIDSHKFHKFEDALDAIPKASFPFKVINGIKAIAYKIGSVIDVLDSSECTERPIHHAYTKQLETATRVAVDAKIELFKAYADIYKKSTDGKPVSIDDFINVEKTYDKATYPLEYIKQQIENDTSGLSTDLKKLSSDFDKSRLDHIRKWKAENPEIKWFAEGGMRLQYCPADETPMKQPTQISEPYSTKAKPQLNK